jgi:DNA polymerase-4
MGHLHTLSHDTSDPAVLQAVLLELSEKVGRRLRAEGAAGRTVTVTLRHRDFTTLSRAHTLDRFLDDGYEIYEAGWHVLERMRRSQGIRMLGVCVSGFSYGPRQTWWLPEVLRQRRLLSACDRINDRFGESTLRRAVLLGEPEAARHYQLKRYTARTL